MIELSLKLGIPMGELQDRLSVEDFYNYLAYFNQKPIDTEAYYHSQLMWVNAQVHSKEPLSSEEFHPDWFSDSDRKKRPVNDMSSPLLILTKIANAGGKIERNNT